MNDAIPSHAGDTSPMHRVQRTVAAICLCLSAAWYQSDPAFAQVDRSLFGEYKAVVTVRPPNGAPYDVAVIVYTDSSDRFYYIDPVTGRTKYIKPRSRVDGKPDFLGGYSLADPSEHYRRDNYWSDLRRRQLKNQETTGPGGGGNH